VRLVFLHLTRGDTDVRTRSMQLLGREEYRCSDVKYAAVRTRIMQM